MEYNLDINLGCDEVCFVIGHLKHTEQVVQPPQA